MQHRPFELHFTARGAVDGQAGACALLAAPEQLLHLLLLEAAACYCQIR